MKIAIYSEFFSKPNKSTIKGFARKHGVTKNTVKKYKKELEMIINSSDSAEVNSNISMWLNNNNMNVIRRKRTKLSVQMRSYVDKCIQSNIEDVNSRHRKMQMKNEDAFQELIDRYNFSRSYELVCYYIKKHKTAFKEAYIRLENKLGVKVDFLRFLT